MNLFCLNKFYDNEEIVVVVLGVFFFFLMVMLLCCMKKSCERVTLCVCACTHSGS